jgi:hypothetical protein
MVVPAVDAIISGGFDPTGGGWLIDSRIPAR